MQQAALNSELRQGMAESSGELLLLLLSNGMSPPDFGTAVQGLMSSSQCIKSQKRRDQFVEAYSQVGCRAAALESMPHCFILYRLSIDAQGNNEGSVEVIELTKRQRGLLGNIDLLGHRIKPAEDPKSKAWLMAFWEEDAQVAWDDLMQAEPCIYIAADGVYVATRYKRVRCKAFSAMPKSAKDVQGVVRDLAPETPLRSVSFLGNLPPSVNDYNVLLAGPIDKSLGPALPQTVGHVKSASNSEVYDCFLQRRNDHHIAEAGKLIAQMLADIGKGLTPLVVAGSTKDASKAYKNAVMKRAYVHESMGKFIKKARSDGQIELWVIHGEVENTAFGKYGKLVFELFYRADLSMY